MSILINNSLIVNTDVISSNMDLLNLQSDNINNFINVSNTISQWTDQSPSLNHATQSTSGFRPLYNSGEPKWDGSDDFLTLTNELALSTFSMYIVFKRRIVDGTALALIGAGNGAGGANNNFFRLDGSDTSGTARQMTSNSVDRPPTHNFTNSWRIGGEETYQVMSFRRTNGSFTVKINDRTVITISLDGSAPNQLMYFKYLGSTFNSLYYDGNIRAICVSSQNLNNSIDNQIIKSLSDRYSLFTSSIPKIVCIGDSITQGGSVETSFPSYIDPLATLLGIPYVNLGIAGQTSAQGLARASSQIITRPYTDKILILFGANDINASVSASDCADNIAAIAQLVINAGYPARNVCLCSPTYQQSNAHSTEIISYRTEIFNRADILGTRKCDFYTDMMNNGADSLMGDGLHPNHSGNVVMANSAYNSYQGA